MQSIRGGEKKHRLQQDIRTKEGNIPKHNAVTNIGIIK